MGNRRRQRMLHGEQAPRAGEGTADAGLEVSPANLQRALLDGVDSPGADGDVLTSRGPGLAPVWGAGGGGGGGGPTTGTDLTYDSATRLLESSTGTDVTLPLATTTVAGLMSGADKAKLDGAASDADLTLVETDVAALEAALAAMPPLGTAAAKDVGVANGVCPLDGTAKVPAIHLPSYVDDVIEVANQAALPATGETGKIYVAADTGVIYRWSGSGYVEIVASPGSTDEVPEGSSNLYYTDARAEAAAQDVVDAALAANPPYALPVATATILGGVKIGSGISAAADGTISADVQAGTGTNLTYTAATRLLESSTGTDVTLPLATTTVDGLMAAADKVKLDGAASEADLTLVETDVAALEAAVAAIPAPVKPDWNAAAGSAGEILNKPPLGTAAAKDVGVASGVCPLDATSKVPAIHLPSFVDDVLEVADVASLPATGDSGIIYVTADTDKVYRWTGTGYVEISPSPGTTDDVPEGSTNLYYTDARAEAVVDANITAYDVTTKTQFMPLDLSTLPPLP
ncbi:MAG: hypothetical protein WBM08_10940 [Prochlorococcaceae cyanobacterium]